jgi:hypothetical protein
MRFLAGRGYATASTGAEDSSCLTPAEVNTARLLYAPQVNPSTKREIAGLQRGSELGWTDMGWSASARATGLDQFNFATDIVRADELDNDTINALDPNLKVFMDRSGKLIQYHGWSDPQISPGVRGIGKHAGGRERCL